MTPPPALTLTNSTGEAFTIGAIFCASEALSTSMRTLWWSGRLTISICGGTSKRDHVWMAQRPSGEML